MTNAKWPKKLPPLTAEQEVISHDFMKHWLGILATRPQYGLVEKFNQQYTVRYGPKQFLKTLEIGAGLGEHLSHEKLTPEQKQNYVALELRENIAKQCQLLHPDIQVTVGDCQTTLPFTDGYFDRIIAIHVLEHLPNLPVALKEMHRLCNKERGVFSVVIPCEGGLAYSLARKISAERVFVRRYKQSYKWFFTREHINRPDEILEELAPYFQIVHRKFFPFLFPSIQCNLCIGMTLRPK